MHAVCEDPLTGELVELPRLDAQREYRERVSFVWRRLGEYAAEDDFESLLVATSVEYADEPDRSWFRILGDGHITAWMPVP